MVSIGGSNATVCYLTSRSLKVAGLGCKALCLGLRLPSRGPKASPAA